MTPLTPQQSDLAEANRGLAWMVARQFHRRYSGENALQELMSICLLSLCYAARTYDPGLGFAFSTYAVRCCKQAIRDERQCNGLIPTPHYLKTRASVGHRFREARDRVHDAKFSEICPDHIDINFSSDPVLRAERDELVERIDHLPDLERLVAQRIIAGDSCSEIGRQTGHSRYKVLDVLHRVREKLVNQL